MIVTTHDNMTNTDNNTHILTILIIIPLRLVMIITHAARGPSSLGHRRRQRLAPRHGSQDVVVAWPLSLSLSLSLSLRSEL